MSERSERKAWANYTKAAHAARTSKTFAAQQRLLTAGEKWADEQETLFDKDTGRAK